jgi:hypothetical protein
VNYPPHVPGLMLRSIEWLPNNRIIRRMQPKVRLILALTTPLRADSEKAELNPRVDARNVIVRELARQFDTEIDDLHAISEGHAEYYADPYHYKAEAINLQAAQVAEKVSALLPHSAGSPAAGLPAK